MKMRKLFAGLLATSIVAAGTSAFAAVPVGNIVETKDTETVSAALPAEGKSGQMTVIVVKLAAPAEGSETVTVPADISDNDIYYIDQAEYTADDMFADLKLKAGLKVGDYFMVRVGGENVKETGIAEAVYQVVADAPPAPVYTLGDVDTTVGIDGNDALTILNYLSKKITLTEDKLLAADVDATVGIDGNDALTILNYLSKKIESFPAADR